MTRDEISDGLESLARRIEACLANANARGVNDPTVVAAIRMLLDDVTGALAAAYARGGTRSELERRCWIEPLEQAREHLRHALPRRGGALDGFKRVEHARRAIRAACGP